MDHKIISPVCIYNTVTSTINKCKQVGRMKRFDREYIYTFSPLKKRILQLFDNKCHMSFALSLTGTR